MLEIGTMDVRAAARPASAHAGSARAANVAPVTVRNSARGKRDQQARRGEMPRESVKRAEGSTDEEENRATDEKEKEKRTVQRAKQPKVTNDLLMSDRGIPALERSVRARVIGKLSKSPRERLSLLFRIYEDWASDLVPSFDSWRFMLDAQAISGGRPLRAFLTARKSINFTQKRHARHSSLPPNDTRASLEKVPEPSSDPSSVFHDLPVGSRALGTELVEGETQSTHNKHTNVAISAGASPAMGVRDTQVTNKETSPVKTYELPATADESQRAETDALEVDGFEPNMEDMVEAPASNDDVEDDLFDEIYG